MVVYLQCALIGYGILINSWICLSKGPSPKHTIPLLMNVEMLFSLSENTPHHPPSPIPTFTQLSLPNLSTFRECCSEKFTLILQTRLSHSPLCSCGNESSFIIKSDHNTILVKIFQRLPISLKVTLRTLVIAYSAIQHLPPPPFLIIPLTSSFKGLLFPLPSLCMLPI